MNLSASQPTLRAFIVCFGLVLLSSKPAQADLIGLWRFDDAGVGTDSGALGNHLTAHGQAASTTGGQGRFGEALSLDPAGGIDWLGIAGDTGGDVPFTNADLTGIPLGGSSYTLSAWIRPSVGAGAAAGIISWGDYGTLNAVNAFRLNTDDGLNNYWWSNDLVGDNLLGGGSFTDGTWRHVAVIYDAAAVGVDHTIYIDGTAVVQRSSNKAVNVAAENFRIGVNNGVAEPWLGLLDDVAVFDEALTQQQLTTIAGGDFSQFGVGTAVPEPSAFGLLGFGLVGLGLRRRKRDGGKKTRPFWPPRPLGRPRHGHGQA